MTGKLRCMYFSWSLLQRITSFGVFLNPECFGSVMPIREGEVVNLMEGGEGEMRTFVDNNYLKIIEHIYLKYVFNS